MTETVCQTMIFILGPIAMILVGRKNKWGFVIGLCSAPFWLISTYQASQWGMFWNSVFYTWIWVYGIYNWFRK